MLNKKYFYGYIAIFLLLIHGCSKPKEDQVSEIDFGETTYFRPFMGSKTESEILEKTLVLEFNDEAFKDSHTFFEIDVVTKKDNISLITDPNVNVYLNDEIIETSPVRLYVKDYIKNNEITIGIQFLPKAKENLYKGYFKIAQTNLDRINDYAIDTNEMSFSIFRWKFNYIKTWNPLFRDLFIIIACIVILLGIWFVFLKNIMFPTFQGGQISIMKDDSNELISLKKRTACVIGNKRFSQNMLSKTFKGKVANYRVNENMQVVIKPSGFKYHRDKNFRRKLLPSLYLRNCKNVLLERTEPDRIRIFDKDFFYNDFTYVINDYLKIRYLNINHPHILNS